MIEKSTAFLLPLRKSWKPTHPGPLATLLGKVELGRLTLICSPTEDERPRSLRVNTSQQSLGSNSPARLKIFPTAWAKFICQSSKELVPASVWKCQPVWLEECEESFPLNSRKHMGADGARRPNLPALAQVELKGAQKGLEFLPLSREGELETRQQQHTGQTVS